LKQVYTYSHLGGEEILLVRYPELSNEIDEIIEAVPCLGRTKESKEKGMEGTDLFGPKDINEKFKEEFYERDWEEGRDYFDIEIPNYPHVVKNSYKQWDFEKDDIMVEVQFGKYAFMFYDLAKFQFFYNRGKMEIGVEIVPCHLLQKEMSSGVSYGEQLVNDLERIGRNFPSVPVKIILIDMPLEGTNYSIEERKKIHDTHQEKIDDIKKTLEDYDILDED